MVGQLWVTCLYLHTLPDGSITSACDSGLTLGTSLGGSRSRSGCNSRSVLLLVPTGSSSLRCVRYLGPSITWATAMGSSHTTSHPCATRPSTLVIVLRMFGHGAARWSLPSFQGEPLSNRVRICDRSRVVVHEPTLEQLRLTQHTRGPSSSGVHGVLTLHRNHGVTRTALGRTMQLASELFTVLVMDRITPRRVFVQLVVCRFHSGRV